MALLTTQVQWEGLIRWGFLITTKQGSQHCSSGFICIYRMCLVRSNSTQSRHTISFFPPSHFSLHNAQLTSDALCNFLSQLNQVKNKSLPCSYRWGAEALTFIKTFVNSLKLVTFNLIIMFNNFTFHFSLWRSLVFIPTAFAVLNTFPPSHIFVQEHVQIHWAKEEKGKKSTYFSLARAQHNSTSRHQLDELNNKSQWQIGRGAFLGQTLTS